MKNIIKSLFLMTLLFVVLQTKSYAGYNFTETWSTDLRSQVEVECKDTNACVQLCSNEKKCVIKNSVCKDCISTGIKMTYFFSAFGKDLVASKNEISVYEFIDFLLNQKFIGFSAKNVYNQFDSAQSDALAKRFKAMCPNKFETPMAFFEIENRELEMKNARYVTCGTKIFALENNSVLLD